MRRVLSATLVAVLLTMLLCQLPWHYTRRGQAAASSAWLTDRALSVTQLGTVQPGHLAPESINGNIDCSPQTLITRPEIVTPTLPHVTLQTEAHVDGCVVRTAYGVVDAHSPNIQLFYTDLAGPITPFSGSAGFMGIPSSLMAFTFTGGSYMQFYTNLISKLEPAVNPLTKQINYGLKAPPDLLLADRAHNSLPANYDSISFSPDGRWMVVNSPGHAILRVNLSSFEIVPFAPAFNYNTGLAPNPQTAISSDGRYIAVGSTSFRRLQIYDLNTCTAAPTVITGPVACQSRDLWPELQAQLPGFSTISTLRFVDDDILSVFAGTQVGTTFSVSKYNLSGDGRTTHQMDYLSLGDSFSSGEGAYDYQVGTDNANNTCHLSINAYPFLIAQRIGSNSFHSVACSGATMNDILGSGPDYPGQVSDKIPLFQRDTDSILQAYAPGYIPQTQFVSRNIPKTMTLTIGGNDLGFSDILKDCIGNLIHPTCYRSYEDRLELLNSINAQKDQLAALYTQLKRDSALDTRIYVIGYPQLVEPGGNCADNVRLNRSELELITGLIDQANAMIKAAATSAGVRFIDVSQALVGHRLCETNSANAAVNGLTFGNDAPGIARGPIGNESYHPNQLGHQLLAKAILAGTTNFTLGMPTATPSQSPKTADNPVLAGATPTGRPLQTIIATQIFQNTVVINQTYTATLNGLTNGMQPSTTYTVNINGQPAGTTQTGTDGMLPVTISLPNAGYQTIDITGPGTNGQLVDLHQTVYASDPTATAPPPTTIINTGSASSNEPASPSTPTATQNVTSQSASTPSTASESPQDPAQTSSAEPVQAQTAHAQSPSIATFTTRTHPNPPQAAQASTPHVLGTSKTTVLTGKPSKATRRFNYLRNATSLFLFVFIFATLFVFLIVLYRKQPGGHT